jgi:hypothetical protein
MGMAVGASVHMSWMKHNCDFIRIKALEMKKRPVTIFRLSPYLLQEPGGKFNVNVKTEMKF